MRVAPRPLCAAFLVLFAFCQSHSGLIYAQSANREAGRTEVAEQKPLDFAAALDWRCIGPANMGGRITALAVATEDPLILYAATASGGLLKTTNGGTTYEHLFDRESVVSIGDVQCAPGNSKLVWIGTGEANPRNSVSFGNGVYKSIDGGKTFAQMGLKESFQIGAIAIDPRHHDTVWIGALGRLWGPNEERGLYRTKDGGKTFERVLFVDERTGVIDLQMKPDDPDTMLVATWERERDGFDTNDPAKRLGPGSGLYRTTDGGETWERVTAGLPSNPLGRIGLSFCEKHPNIVYAVVDCQRIGERPEDLGDAGLSVQSATVGAEARALQDKGAAAEALLKVGDVIISLAGERILNAVGFETALAKFSVGAEVVLEVVRGGELKAVSIKLKAYRSSDANAKPFGTRLGGQIENIGHAQGPNGHEFGGIYRSEDAGATWSRVNSLNPRPMYFSEIRVDPSDPDRIIVLGISFHISEDGGKTFRSQNTAPGVHVDHHALWIDPKDGRHWILGNDGGLYVTRDRGAHWDHHNHFVISQFYDVAIDARKNYSVYGGLQDNGTWGGPSTGVDGSLLNEDWIRIGGGDGFVCQVDPEDHNLIYYESQNGALQRRHLLTGSSASLQPRAPRGTTYRWNWHTPFILSHHNAKTWITAGNYVFKSVRGGLASRRISPEITRTKRGSATALAESPRDPERIAVGTDDGALFATSDGGTTWENLWPEAPSKTAQEEGNEPSTQGESKANRPLNEWVDRPMLVSGLVWSRFETGRLYLSLDGHRSNDDRPYAFMSLDSGKTWVSLTDKLPAAAGCVRTIEEDLRQEDILYLGTEFGAYVSLDRGRTWHRMNSDLPTVAVHAFAQSNERPELIAATHGRGIWILDVNWLRQLSLDVLTKPAHLFRPKVAEITTSQPSRGGTLRRYSGEGRPLGAELQYALAKPADAVQIEILDIEGKSVAKIEGQIAAGLHTIPWNLRQSVPPERARRARFGPRVAPGQYLVRLLVDGALAGTAVLRVESAAGTETDGAREEEPEEETEAAFERDG